MAPSSQGLEPPGIPGRFNPATSQVDSQLDLEDQAPLTLGFPRPEPVGEGDWRYHDTVMVVRVERLGSDGRYQPSDYHIRFSRAGGEGVYTPSDIAALGEQAPWKEIDPLILT